MNDEELENAINKIVEALNEMGDVNMFCDQRQRNMFQKRLHRASDILFDLKKHLEFLKNTKGRQKWDLI